MNILKPLLKIVRRGTPLEKALLRNHLFAVGLLILATLGVFFVQREMLSAQKDAAWLVNTSGKQRMTSQKLFRYLFEAAALPKRRNVSITMDTYEQMMENHEMLLSRLLEEPNSISYQDKAIYTLYFGDRGLNALVRNFQDHFERFPVHGANLQAVETLLDDHGTQLLNRFEEAVDEYQRLSERRIARLMVVEQVLAFLMVLLIVLEGFFIFRPAILEVYRENLFLRRHRQNLERRVKREVRMRQDQERLFIQRSKLAEMGEMLNNIAHQWKQPLNILSLAAGDIKEELERHDLEHTKESLEELFTQIRFMSKTIDNFRNFYQPDRKAQHFCPAEAIASVAGILERVLKQNDLSVRIEGATACRIEGYENEFKQIVLNLLNNAKDAINEARQKTGDDKPGELIFRLEQKDDRLVIYAEDNGPGIDESVAEKIFNPYFSTKHDKGGTGIGLYMIRTILVRHFGGDIQLRPSKEGACFEITLARCFAPQA